MNLEKIHSVYFVGIGGIGMSAIARYFSSIGKTVAGYDKTKTDLTDTLINEGILIHFDENIDFIESNFGNKENTLVIYTPAIPKENKELIYLKEHNYRIVKRAEVLGIISEHKNTIAVAGTHGKTSISTIIAHLLYRSKQGCSAFLGGISKNFNSNLVITEGNNNIVVEADEFDRSFLYLYPNISVISSIDADHLDIYGSKEELKKSFEKFVSQIKPNGYLIIKENLRIKISDNVNVYTYSVNSNADFNAKNIILKNAVQTFDLDTPFGEILNLKLGIPGIINIENAVAAIAVALLSKVDKSEIQEILTRFKGVKRRFDYIINTENLVFIDDYAHHPEELRATISSVKELYPNKKITGVFQPHLFSRTKDFYNDFAKSLDLLDEIILMDIYPAREKPIEGISSEIIFNEIKNKNKTLCNHENLIDVINTKQFDVLLTLGAGDIDKTVNKIKETLIA